VVEWDTRTENKEKEWQVESDRQQVEKGSDTTQFMEFVRKHVPTARYPVWSTGAQREKQIKEEVERQRRDGPELEP
jgi:hypothetical protein